MKPGGNRRIRLPPANLTVRPFISHAANNIVEPLTKNRETRGYSFGEFTLDLSRNCLIRSGQFLHLRPKSFEALCYLVGNSGRLIGKEELIQALWPDTFVTDDSLVKCMRDVRLALGEDCNNYIKTVARKGYIFDVEVIEHGSKARSAVYSKQVDGLRVVIEDEEGPRRGERVGRRVLPVPASGESRWLSTRKLLVVSGLLIGLALALFYILRPSGPKQPAGRPHIRSIAVLPFKSLVADDNDEYLGLGMADTVITKLSSLGDIVVRPTSAVQRYISADQDSLAAGREQKVDAVLEGSIQRSGDKVRVTVRLMNVGDGSPLWAYKCDESCAGIFALQDAISEKVAGALALNMTSEERQLLAKRYTDNTEAFQLYVRGVFLRNQMTEEGLKKSIDSFQKAIELDPNYALAYAGQASSYSPLAYVGYISVRDAELKNRSLITKALELDDTLAEAHAALAELKLFMDLDWEGAEREFKRAIELNPNEQLSHLLYPDLLFIKGRSEEALALSKSAFENDPMSPRTAKALAHTYYFAGQYDQAIEQSNKTRELFPSHPLVNPGPSYERKGMYEQAIKEYLDAEAHRGMPAQEIAMLRQAYVTSGWRSYWQKRLNLAKTEAIRKPVQAVFLAELYARIGEKDQALEWLERAFEERSMALIFLKVDPIWESLRPMPKFQDLVRRMRLSA